jgi:hypothetical protein
MKITRQELLGSIVLCPHCNQKLRIVAVGPRIVDVDSGKAFFMVMFTDREFARFWEED